MTAYDPIITAAAAAYHANPQILDNMWNAESGRSKGADPNLWDSNAKAGTPSEGGFQFIKPTFDAFSQQAKAADPAAWNGVNDTWLNPQAQALTTAWAITNGHQGDWTTYAKAAAGLNPKATVPAGAVATPVATPSTPAASAATTNPIIAQIFENGGMDPTIANLVATSPGSPTTPATSATTAPAAGGSAVSKVLTDATAQSGDLLAKAAAYAKSQGQPFDSAWCGDFVQSVFHQAGLAVPPARSVPGLLSWAQANKTLTHTAAPGDLELNDWNGDGIPDHVGIVTSNGQEISGNTSGPNGNTVAVKPRASNTILGYVDPYG